MSTQDTPNHPAFPAIDGITYEEGMSLRDYFAAKAMQKHMDRASEGNNSHIGFSEYKDIAEYSYQMADAMLKERVRTP